MIGSPKPTSYESLMPSLVNPLSSTHPIPSTRPSAAVNAAVIVLFLCCFLPLGESKKAQKIKRLTGKGRRMRAEQRENTDPGVLTSWLRVLARRRDAAAGQRQSCGA